MILNDKQIKQLAVDQEMISPFVNESVAKGISHGLNSFGYDLRCGSEFKIFTNIKNKSHMYFVHSYEFIPDDKSVISATTEYSSKIVCSVERDNLFGTQFHPEKSDKTGLQIIDNFIKL